MEGHLQVIFMALFGVSEALALIPGVKSNSIFQLCANTLKGILGK